MTDYTCYLPFRGEFGWYLLAFIKMVYSNHSPNKIVCIKHGHECLFPDTKEFYYDWQDISDDLKGGAVATNDEEEIKNRIIQKYPNDNITFISHIEIGWHNKHDFAQYSFLPQNRVVNNLKTNIVIAPRKRNVDSFRNWTKENWQYVVNKMVQAGLTVGMCGNKETSFDLENIAYKSYDYTDVDSDVEMLLNSQLVVCQESGIQYLSFLCKRPTICIDYYGSIDLQQDLHRDALVPYKSAPHVWSNPQLLVDEILYFMQNKEFIPVEEPDISDEIIVDDLPQDLE